MIIMITGINLNYCACSLAIKDCHVASMLTRLFYMRDFLRNNYFTASSITWPTDPLGI